MATKKTTIKKVEPTVQPDYLAPIDHFTGMYHPEFLWACAASVVNGITGATKYVTQLITESYSEINVVFDEVEGEIWLVSKPRLNVIIPSAKVDDMRLKASKEMKAVLSGNKELMKSGKNLKPVPSFGSMLDALTGPLAKFLGRYKGWEIIRGWTSQRLAEAMEESGKMVDVKGARRIGNVNANTALFTTYLPVYLVRIKKDEDYKGTPADDAAEIIGARGFKPEELRQLILGKGQYAKEGGMICGLSLAALQLFTLWALDEAPQGSPEQEFAINL